MISRRDAATFFTRGVHRYLPHLSVDCAVFGFHGAELRLLLLKWKGMPVWALPGGYVGRRESLDDAARRVLSERTALRRVYLEQFHTFGRTDRHEADMRKLFTRLGVKTPPGAWPVGRVVSVGYYALVDFSKVRPRADYLSDDCSWHPVDALPHLAFDHGAIVDKALATLRASLESGAPGATLLPPRFTMPELQRLHETILGRRLDRRNFQKKMLDRAIVERLPDRRTGGAHRSPFLYRFKRRHANPNLEP